MLMQHAGCRLKASLVAQSWCGGSATASRTSVHRPCFRMSRQGMTLGCLAVKGAAMDASPGFTMLLACWEAKQVSTKLAIFRPSRNHLRNLVLPRQAGTASSAGKQCKNLTGMHLSHFHPVGLFDPEHRCYRPKVTTHHPPPSPPSLPCHPCSLPCAPAKG